MLPYKIKIIGGPCFEWESQVYQEYAKEKKRKVIRDLKRKHHQLWIKSRYEPQTYAIFNATVCKPDREERGLVFKGKWSAEFNDHMSKDAIIEIIEEKIRRYEGSPTS